MAAIYFANTEGTWTSTPGTPIEPNTMEMGIVFNTQISTSPLSGDVKTLELPGARWRTRLSYSDMTEEETRPLLAWLSSLKGSAGRFFIYDFSLPTPLGGLTSANYALNTRSSLTISNAVGGLLAPGDLFSITASASTVPELKMVTEKVTDTLYSFQPVTRKPIDQYSNGLISTSSGGLGTLAYAHMMLTSDDQSLHATADKGLISTVTIEAVEVFA